ncbi:unnamed protein product [Adineta steineri]|uniref:Peptide hydrolase n=1 Tax=Adineta steineri TaxID=433720 RepID=A0A813WSY8_9BILA|nr:unnamed protein product [Adineta steineri]
MRTMLFIGIIFGIIGLISAMSVNKDRIELSKQSANEQLAPSMKIDEVMNHLNELQKIAMATTGKNRAVGTIGFNNTLDYIENSLTANTNFKVFRRYFKRGTFSLQRNPTLISTINGVAKTHTYSTSGEFYHVQYSTSVTLNENVLLTAIPNLGCSDEDWLAARPPPAGLVVLVKRGDCTFVEKARLAEKYKVAALLFYNNGQAGDGSQPIYVNIGTGSNIPALFLSNTLGTTLVNAANDPSRMATVRLTIATAPLVPIGNICAATLTGDPTQTILIGSHTDSVPAGPGINDNGSGTAVNLALAATLYRLMQTSTYDAYKYRVQFCFWGGEELGLLGSAFHAAEAKTSTVVGERISDYLININLDMVGSPNFIFGIYDGRTAPSNTPAAARPGSLKISTLFQTLFNQNSLPWDHSAFDGRSDYGPFLAAGVVAGGLFTGADALKTVEQRNRYNSMLGSNLGGTSGIRQDRCYHLACDTTTNINQFALDIMMQAAAYSVESMGQQSDLKSWLYPAREIQEFNKQTQQTKYEYNNINEYFGMPYS